jgi:hypothetical protein
VPLGLWLTLALSVVVQARSLDASTLAVAVASCDQVLPGHCTADRSSAAEFHVLLSADAELASARIEVHRGAPDGPLSLSRTLELDVKASREERARALGLVIAAHVLGQTPRTVAAPTPMPRVERSHWALDGAALVGTALDQGGPRLGGMLRGSWRTGRVPLGLVASLRGWARPEREPRLWWLALTAGMLTHGAWGRLALEGRLELVAQRTAAAAEQGGRRETTHAYRVGGQLGGELLVRLSEANWLFVGAEAGLLWPRVELYLAGRRRGAEPELAGSALLGFRRAW